MSAEENMEETTSWKGHSFTLIVFGGIVVLCSIFFVLGMLVGRSQGQRMAEMTAADAAVRKTPAEARANNSQALTFEGTLETAEPKPELALEAAPPPPELVPDAAPAPPVPVPVAVPAGAYLQVAALRTEDAAKRMVQEVKAKGFASVFFLSPPSDTDPLYRVQVGPYGSTAEADIAKRELEAAGYKDVQVKK